VVADTSLITLAPTRQQTAVVATHEFLGLAIGAGLFFGFAAARSTLLAGIVWGVVVGMLIWGPAYWRAQGIKLVIDREHGILIVRNLLQTHKIGVRQMEDIEVGEEVIGRGRYRSMPVRCLQIIPRGSRRVWIQASLGNGEDHSVADALEEFCRANGVRCMIAPKDMKQIAT
jgi:hypothetical protein